MPPIEMNEATFQQMAENIMNLENDVRKLERVIARLTERLDAAEGAVERSVPEPWPHQETVMST